ncbi:MAG: adenosylcobinamide-GDP ribazoletransferase [Rhodocyclaceae bacterium]
MIQKEIGYFFGAVRFFTRLPVPAWVGHSQEALDRAARYFPLVGILVGVLGGLTFLLAAFVLPVSLALLFSMAATLLVTGAFHEDGLADAVDGFGGGWTKPQVLAIMKDSRIGSYGALAVALMLLAKFNALHELPDDWIAPALVAAHAASRFCSTVLIYALDYVREDAPPTPPPPPPGGGDGGSQAAPAREIGGAVWAKSKPLAVRMGAGSLAVAALFGLAPLALLPWQAALAGLGLAALTAFLAARYFIKRIGGYTGDCLGATQQGAELAIYVGILAVAWNFS